MKEKRHDWQLLEERAFTYPGTTAPKNTMVLLACRICGKVIARKVEEEK